MSDPVSARSITSHIIRYSTPITAPGSCGYELGCREPEDDYDEYDALEGRTCYNDSLARHLLPTQKYMTSERDGLDLMLL